jgi:ribosome-associated toxin RatA of RatAB toxin-antitoxin module
MFDLVADIERYPEFLDEYREARILARRDNTLKVHQLIGLPLVNLPLDAEAILNCPDSIIVRSNRSLLGDLEIRWKFALTATGTRIEFRMTLTPSSPFGEGIAQYLLSKSATHTLHAFAGRAAKLYGLTRR